MKRLFQILCCFILFYGSLIAQVKKSGDIDGEIWTANDSLYIVTGNIAVIELTIEPGVIIQFDGNYKFEVEGVLQAVGFYSDSIYFQPQPGNLDGWQGIKFKSSAISSSLIYCRIEGASKDGLSIDQAQPHVANCRIIDNDGTGIFLKSTTIQIEHCIIAHNTLNGIETNDSQLSILNSIISDNENSGIVSTNNADRILLTNIVIADNSDRGINCPGGNLTIRNSIIYNNTFQIDSQDDKTSVTYSDIQGIPVFPGIGNINTEPEFLTLRLYTLSPQSPCIDAGDPISTDSDKYFPPSLGSSRNDMGAYGGPLAFGWYPPLYIKPQSIDFKRVTQDSSRSTNLEILNYRDTGIAIPGLLFEGDGASVFSGELSNNFVPVSESIELTLTFKPELERVYTSDLLLQTQSHGTVSLPIRGQGVLPHIIISLSELNFNHVPVGESLTFNVPVQNTGGDTLQLQLVQPSNMVFQIEQTTLNINPDLSSDTLRISFTPDSVASYQDSLIIFTNDRDRPRIAIQLSGEGFGPVVHISPVNLNFGSVAVLSDTLISVSISNQGNNFLDIDSLILIQPEFSDETFSITDITGYFPVTLDPDSTLLFSVQFTPKDWGLLSGRLLVYSSDPLHEMIAVGLVGTGLASEIVVSSTELNFGEILITADSTQNLNIENIGNSQLLIEELNILPPDSSFELSDPIISFPFEIDPGSSAEFPIRFMPADTGLIDGQILILSNDPYFTEVSVLLSGRGSDSGLFPSIELSSDKLEFNEVDTSSYSQKYVTIYNRGPVDLIIPEDSIYIKDSTFGAFSIINVSVEIRVDPQDSLNITIRFKPRKLGPDQANLWISSNDTLNPQMIVHLSGTGVGDGFVPEINLSSEVLEFYQVDIDSFSLQSLFVYNLGYTDLIIPRDGIYITDSAQDAFSIADPTNDIMIAPGDSQEVVILFEPPELGPDQANLLINSNDPLNESMIVMLTGIGIGNGSAAISFDQSNSTNPLIDGQPATMSFDISSFVPIDSAFIFVRRGGETSFTSFSLQMQSATNIWSTDIESHLITERGVEYYVRVNQSYTFSIYPQDGEIHPHAVSVQIPYLTFPDEIPAKTYQMISVPFNTPGQTLSDLFIDNLGPYNDSNYRIFECTNGAEYSEIRDMNKPLPPGKSVWLISKKPAELDINNGASVSTELEYTIELQQGWNMISNPFAFPVSWTNIGTGLALRYYDGNDWPFSFIMEPFKGYAVNTPKDTVISIPPIEAEMAKSLSKPIILEDGDIWQFQITAESEKINDRFNFVGVRRSATSEIDRFDYPEPLPIGDYISLYLVSPENNAHLSTDYRRPGADGYIFNIEILCNISANKMIKMYPENLPDSYEWMVLSSTTKVNYGRNPIQTSSNHLNLKLIVGTQGYIKNNTSEYQSLPTEYKLAQNFPNPFNPNTKITYQLPVSSEIEMSIYNILGQRVTTLVSELQEAGYYQLEWNGLNQSHHQVSSGIYFLHLQTKQFTKTIKMIMQR